MINAAQIRAARALLDWSREYLATVSGVSMPALTKIEGSKSNPHTETLNKLQRTFEQAGVLFTDNSGVKLKSDIVTIYEGGEGVKSFADDLYFTAQKYGGEFLISGGYQSDFFEAIGEDYLNLHAARMRQIEGFKIRALKPLTRAEEKGLDYIDVRWLSEQMFFTVPFYVYHNKLAILLWNPSRIVILDDRRVADAYKSQFEVLWRLAKRHNGGVDE